ncbi:hypothetical protein HDU87_008447 [Geranomyces variabilis]|uniref:FAD-binding FR-type domain-containing protein n=1 Tax=Geranomyces variabilis TaxID=109894 RepID=A0AAD5TF96_9FUNG|nr:hypothetical protein HDU87_008447 [Geranomyces variabilis]
MGYGMFTWVLIHLTSFLSKSGLRGGNYILQALFGIGAPFEQLSDYMEFFGFMAISCFIIGFIPALPWLRRRHFNMFYIAHVFMLFMIVFAILHSTTCVYYAFPGIILWVSDLALRAVARKTAAKFAVNRVVKEPTGYIRMDIDTSQPIPYTPGQYVFLSVPSVSPLEYHPFSIAGSANSPARLSLLIAPMWKSSEWTNKLAARFLDAERGGSCGDPVVLEGPFGHCGFDVLNVNVVTCFVSGSGVAPAFGLARYVADAQSRGTTSGPKKVVIVWAVRAPGPQHSSHIADLQAAFAPGMLEIYIFDTSRSEKPRPAMGNRTASADDEKKDTDLSEHIIVPDVVSERAQPTLNTRPSKMSISTIPVSHDGVHHYTHRMSVPTVFQTGITPLLKAGGKLGVFICATEGLRRDIRDAVYELEHDGVKCFIHEETYEL